MTQIASAGTYRLGDRTVRRMGYGAMQLAGPGVFGPPKDRDACVAVLREAVAQGVDHIDTSDFYGPHVVNQIIAEALHPYPAGLTLVTKIGARRDEQGGWLPAMEPEQLAAAVQGHDRRQADELGGQLEGEDLELVALHAQGQARDQVVGRAHAPGG